MTVEPRCWGGGGGVSHPLQLTTGLVIKSVTTSPTLAGERILFILQVSILSEQTGNLDSTRKTNVSTRKRNRGRTSLCAAKKRNGKFGCVMGGLSVSESVQRESEQLANEGTSVNEGWKVVSICLCFYWYFWRA